MTNQTLKTFARQMMDADATDQFIDAIMLTKFQKSHGVTECKKAIAEARIERAAPQLLGALSDMVNDIQNGRTEWDTNGSLHQALAAIKKARGE